MSEQEVLEAETNWNIPIIKVEQLTLIATIHIFKIFFADFLIFLQVRHAGLGPSMGQGAPSNLPEVATALNTICEQLWLAKHRDQL